MNLRDLIANLEAEVAALFARFRSHPVVQAQAAEQAPPVQTAIVPPEPATVISATTGQPTAHPTVTDLMFQSADPAKYVPSTPAGDSTFDPHKTNLGPSDFGQVFKADPPGVTYTLDVPNGCHVFMLRDGEFFPDQWATYSVDSGPVEQCNFTGPIANVGPGVHTVVVGCNYEMSFQIQPA